MKLLIWGVIIAVLGFFFAVPIYGALVVSSNFATNVLAKELVFDGAVKLDGSGVITLDEPGDYIFQYEGQVLSHNVYNNEVGYPTTEVDGTFWAYDKKFGVDTKRGRFYPAKARRGKVPSMDHFEHIAIIWLGRTPHFIGGKKTVLPVQGSTAVRSGKNSTDISLANSRGMVRLKIWKKHDFMS